MENIFWGGELMKLESVALRENKINEWRETLQRAVNASLIPLKAYAEGRFQMILLASILEQRKGHQRKRTKEREMEKKMTFVGIEPTPSAIRADVLSQLD